MYSMKPVFVYSGTFDPPTYGHLTLLEEAAKVFPKIIVVCSDHTRKKSKFTQEERVELWQSYSLPKNIEIETFSQFLERGIPGEQVVLIRGIRGKSDNDHETEVLLESAKNHGVNKAFYILCKQGHCHTSSSRVWTLAKTGETKKLINFVSKVVAKKVIKRLG